MIVEPAEWKRRVALQGCFWHASSADCDGPVQGCHVIPQQTLKRNGHREALWDVRNGVGACERAHRRHDLHVERWPRERLPAYVLVFAEELGLGWYMDRHYPHGRGAVSDDVRYEETIYGFRFGACEVTRTALFDGRVVLTIRTDAGREIQVYVSTLGRSLRVFDINVEANHTNRELK